jgi:hypothetical protein
MRLAGRSQNERDGLGDDEVAPRPWRAEPIGGVTDAVRIVDAAGREVGRLRAPDARWMLARVDAAAGCACVEAHEAHCRATGLL